MLRLKINKKKIIKIFLWTSFYISLFLISAFITMFILVKGETIQTPNLIGKTEKEAIKILTKNNLYLTKRKEVFSLKYPEGVIVSQKPEPGVKIKKNHFVIVNISLGGERVTVPDLRHKSIKTAEIELKQYSIPIINIASIHYKYKTGDIIEQDPSPGKESFKKAGLNLLISDGPRKLAYVMPDLIGKNIVQVIHFMEKKGFKIEGIRKVEYQGIPSGTIVRQNPMSGYKIKKGNIITLDIVK